MGQDQRRVVAADRGEGPYLWRFTPLQRTLHILIIVSFFGLVLTGLPLHFSYAPWAVSIMRFLGGFETAGVLHRIGAIVTAFYFGAHLVQLLRKVLRGERGLFWGPDSMVPGLSDVRDVFARFYLVAAGDQRIEMDLSGLSAGPYLLRLRTGSGSQQTGITLF